MTDTENTSRPIKVAVCPVCDKRTLHYIDTAECMICATGEING